MPAEYPRPISATEVRDEIRVIGHSKAFAQSHRRIELLEYLCNMVLLGRHDEIKESTIALDVFGRTCEFDDKKDSIVRVEAHRLRQRLSKYYATEGSQDRVVIELAPGGYIPRFVVLTPAQVEGLASTAATSTAPTSTPAQVDGPASVIPTSTAALSPVRQWHFEPSSKLMLGAVALAVFALGAAVMTSRLGSGSNKPGPRPPSVAPAPPLTGGIRILAGSTKPYIDRVGRQWRADEYFAGGVAEPGPTDFLGRPPDPSLYRTMRYGDFSYAIPVPPGVYELRLHFAEPRFRSRTDVGIDGGEDQRHFTVLLNGKGLLNDFDVVTDSGNSAVDVRAFRDIAPAADGFVHLQFQGVEGQPFVNAIELIPGVPGRILPIRIRASDSSFTDQAGNIWNPDDYYIGGRLTTHKASVSRTPDPDLYLCERYGNFSYAIPVPPGRYAVTLYFAETYWDPEATSAAKGGVGSRVFNVSCNGAILLPDFDLLKEAKSFQAVSHTFHNLRPNGQGKLLLSFSPVVNYASVKAIEVRDEQERQPR
jgi:hypothetical protein